MEDYLISINDVSKEEIHSLIDLAKDIKNNTDKYAMKMDHKTLAMIFEKPSLRTRVSFETGMTKMGGHAIYLGKDDIQLGRGETIGDTSAVTSRYVDIIMARTFEFSTVEELAKNATVPVINGLTNDDHPCQILGDLQTISEKLGKIDNLKLAFLGDCANNTCHSWLQVAPKIGMTVACGFPKGYGPKGSILKMSDKDNYVLTNDSEEAVKDADVIYTDTWMSLHIPEAERKKRFAALKPYQVTTDLMKKAKPEAIFMHCLPCHRGEEMTADVVDGPQSVVLEEAENRMWIQNAIMLRLLKLA
jgi:ornithine carbamoyltransferase